MLHNDIKDADEISSIQYRSNFWVDKPKSYIEQETDVFAANLLMPKSLIIKFFNKVEDVALLSTLFGVSQESITYRLRDLRLI